MPLHCLRCWHCKSRQPGNFGSRLLAEDPLFPLRTVLVAPSPAFGYRWRTARLRGCSRLRAPGLGMAIVTARGSSERLAAPSSIALQGALMRAGYDVPSVDHPGFGSSRAAFERGLREWDPALCAAVALKVSAAGTARADDHRGGPLDGRGCRSQVRRGRRTGTGHLSLRGIARSSAGSRSG